MKSFFEIKIVWKNDVIRFLPKLHYLIVYLDISFNRNEKKCQNIFLKKCKFIYIVTKGWISLSVYFFFFHDNKYGLYFMVYILNKSLLINQCIEKRNEPIYHLLRLPLVSLGPRYFFPGRLFCYPFHLVFLVKDFIFVSVINTINKYVSVV